MAKLILVKTQGGLVAATEHDQQTVSKIKIGAVIECDFTQKRNSKFHRKFFALLNLAFDYYEPKGGLIPDSEMRGIKGLAQYLANYADSEPLLEAARQYAKSLLKSRGEKFTAVEKDFEGFRRWVTLEAGYYTLIQTPVGITKTPASISFAKMTEEEFQGLYKSVFTVLWRVVLAGVFENEQQAENAVNQLLSFT